MQCRVRSRAGDRLAIPATFCGVASGILADKHQTCGASRLCGELQAAASGQRQGLFRLCNDETDGNTAQRFFNTPEQVDLAHRPQQMQPRANIGGQAAQHRQIGGMGGQNPHQRARMPRCLKQRKGPPPPAIGLMDAPLQKAKGITRCSFKPHLHAHLPPRFATPRPVREAVIATHPPRARSASAAIPLVWSGSRAWLWDGRKPPHG